MSDDRELLCTPLEAEHQAMGAKLGAFAGWRMPIEYAGSLKEHRAVRDRVGLFDLTHLGKIDVTGPGAIATLQRTLSNDLETAAVGEALYNLVLGDDGGVIDDLIAYRLGEQRYFLVPNASNTERVLGTLTAQGADLGMPIDIVHHPDWCLLAVQGPDSGRATGGLFPEVSALGFMECAESVFQGQPVIVARSGYTGELGFELFFHQDAARELWGRLVEAIAPFGGEPCGLAARDVLRLEMGYPLYGQDLSEAATPLEAGLAWAVAFDKKELKGRTALLRQKKEDPPARLRGLRMRERRHIPRAHCPVLSGDRVIGEVTSGTFSPLLQAGIGLAYLRPADVVEVGDEVQVEIRGRKGAAQIVRPPFVERSPR